MITFEVKDMTCGHCAGAITRAVRATDAGARVEVDLASHRVTIAAAQAGASEFAEAIAAAGYTPQPVAAAPVAAAGPRAGACCGCRG